MGRSRAIGLLHQSVRAPIKVAEGGKEKRTEQSRGKNPQTETAWKATQHKGKVELVRARDIRNFGGLQAATTTNGFGIKGESGKNLRLKETRRGQPGGGVGAEMRRVSQSGGRFFHSTAHPKLSHHHISNTGGQAKGGEKTKGQWQGRWRGYNKKNESSAKKARKS